MKSHLKKIIGLTVTLLSLVVFVALYTNRQAILDWWKLRSYQPSAEIARLSSDASMNDLGRRLFYIHDPELLNKENFAGKCMQSEETIVLGCYISNFKIYVFNVNEETLGGVEEVTAAHEMLHAAYERLSERERNHIDKLTEEVYKKSEDERLKRTIESYRKRDPSVVNNELHSIIGTEVRSIPEELERYYSRYFLNRLDIVTLAEQYANEFESREKQIIEYDAQLKQLEAEIKTKESELVQLEVALDTEKAQLESLRSNPEAFNQQVPAYNQKVRDYNQSLQGLRQQIDEYNRIVAARNTIATEEKTLLEAINSRTTVDQ